MINRWRNSGNNESLNFYFFSFKITGDVYCSHEIKRHLLLGRKVMTNPDNILKCRDSTLPRNVHHFFKKKKKIHFLMQSLTSALLGPKYKVILNYILSSVVGTATRKIIKLKSLFLTIKRKTLAMCISLSGSDNSFVNTFFD